MPSSLEALAPWFSTGFLRPMARDSLKPVFHLANLFARREAKTRIRQRDWLTLVGEKIRREQVGTVPTFFSVRANKFAKWKTGLSNSKDQWSDLSIILQLLKISWVNNRNVFRSYCSFVFSLLVNVYSLTLGMEN